MPTWKAGCLLLGILLLFAGCSCHKGNIYAWKGENLYAKEWETIVSENRIGKEENIRVTPLYGNDASSHYIIQINDREKPHVHETHDLTVVVKRGEGTLHLGRESLPMKGGDLAFIPRGTAHWFENGRKGCPSVAYVIFTPAYDGKDNRPVAEAGQ